MELSYFDAALLGAIQGLTEFLPVSSSAHLALSQHFMGLHGESDPILAFDLATHVGTVISILLVFWTPILHFAGAVWSEVTNRHTGRRTALPILGLAIIASIPTALIGVLFKDELEAAFGWPLWITGELFVTGIILWLTSRIPLPRRGWRQFGGWRAFVVGVVQGISILPGISRSGSTISAALLLGLKRRWAAQFSFLIGMPAILGAAALKSLDIIPKFDQMRPFWGPIALGTVIATITGYLSLKWLIGAVRKAKLHWFAYYCWAVSITVAAILLTSGKSLNFVPDV